MGGYYWHSDNPNCGRCGHLNGQGFCNMTACIYPVLPQTAVMTEHRLTNGDRIRAMTDEELEVWLVNLCCASVGDAANARVQIIRGNLLNWLKQEVNE